MKVLLAEDSPNIRKYTAMALEHAGYAVDTAVDGAEALWCLEGSEYDVVILDIMMPNVSGLEVLNKLRQRGNKVHILLLTAMDATEDKVAGLRSGADDYLVKPFEVVELIARVEALARRTYGVKSPQVHAGCLCMDTSSKSFTVKGKGIELTAREYALLEYLILRKGEVVSRVEIEEHIYDMNADLMSNAVNSAVSILRKKLEQAGGKGIIQTKRGMGYFIETV